MPACLPSAIRRHFRPAVASEYIDRLGDVHKADPRPVVLLLRVSTPEQEQAGNLTDQDADIHRKLAAAGIRESEVVAVVRGVESSRIHAGRPLLELAINIARKCGGRVVADSTDRFVRRVEPDGRVSEQAPLGADFALLKHFAHGVPLATIEDPDCRARSKQVRRGQTAKGNAGGRPRKIRAKERRESRIEFARQLRNEGLSLRAIAKRLNEQVDGHAPVVPNTIRNWVCNFLKADAGKRNPNPKKPGVCSEAQPQQPVSETITVRPVPQPPLPDPIPTDKPTIEIRNQEVSTEPGRTNNPTDIQLLIPDPDSRSDAEQVSSGKESHLATNSSTGRLTDRPPDVWGSDTG